MNDSPDIFTGSPRSERASMQALNAGATASRVNRTHRVVRERAKLMQDRRNHTRSLWAPMIVCSALLLIVCTAVWSVFEQYEASPTGPAESADHSLVLLLWFLPLSAALLMMVWVRRSRTSDEDAN